METKKSILIEMSVEACLLPEDKIVANPLGSYGGLPWLANAETSSPTGVPAKFDINFENAFLGEEVLAPPFQNANSILRKGVHLHWIVPGFLGLEQTDPNDKTRKAMPAAPNRWRIQKNNDPNHEWLVVSDYVHSPVTRLITRENGQMKYEIDWEETFSVFPDLDAPDHSPPFCYLGKCFPLTQAPQEEELRAQSFHKKKGRPLTITGYGSVQFSASYVNCRSVFGFYDENGKSGDSYTVTGWHAQPEDDVVRRIVNEHSNQENFSLPAVLKQVFDVDMPEQAGDAPPLALPAGATLYVCRVQIDVAPPGPDTGRLKISVGNTATEAISALTAFKLKDDDRDKIWPSGSRPGESWRRKIQIEDRLEYMLMNAQIDGYLVDKASKFLEARHQQGFSIQPGGLVYEFADQEMGRAGEMPGIPLSASLQTQLEELNGIRVLLNETENELQSLEAQLYTDWYKYMRAAYPPLGASDTFADRDHLQHLVQVADLNTLTVKRRSYTGLQIDLHEKLLRTSRAYITELDKNLKFLELLSSENPKSPDAEAHQSAMNAMNLEKTGLQASERAQTEYLNRMKSRKEADQDGELRDLREAPFELPPVLKEIPEPSFREPQEPVLAIDGFDLKQRSTNTLARLSDITWESPSRPKTPVKEQVTETKLSALPWCPSFMEWQVGLEDVTIDMNYPERWEEALLDHFDLDDDSPGIYRKPAERSRQFDGTYFQGGGFLNPFMIPVFTEGIQKYTDFCKRQEERASETNEKNIWEGNRAFSETVRAEVEKSGIMCQRLAGFNAACLQLRKVPQLQLREPLGFTSSVTFTETVARVGKNAEHLSPSPLYDFLPVRNGRLLIRRLRFLDNFGRITDFNSLDDLITADTLSPVDLRISPEDLPTLSINPEQSLREVFLPPRLVQPSRLNVKTLTKSTGNSPATPICGWIVPNFLDDSLMLFSADGTALGTLRQGEGWQPVPWQHTDISLDEVITDDHFRKVVYQILENPGSFIPSLVSVLQNVLAGTAPADFALSDARVLLTGRPLAVVRIHVRLEIKGYPALDQSWRASLLDTTKALGKKKEDFLEPRDRYSGGWNKINLPIRIGEYRQLNDGLAGYWLEKDEKLLNIFYAPSSEADDSPLIRSAHEAESGPLTVRPDDSEGMTITALIDPRGVVHITTGVLPTETVSLPPGLVAPALSKMQLWFETGPVLHYKRPPAALPEEDSLPELRFFDLPGLPGYQWAWYDPETGKEMEIAQPVFNEIHERLPEIIHGHLVLKKK